MLDRGRAGWAGPTSRPRERLGLRVHAVEAASRLAAVAADVDAVQPCRGELDELWSAAASRRGARAPARRRRRVQRAAGDRRAALLQDALGLPGPGPARGDPVAQQGAPARAASRPPGCASPSTWSPTTCAPRRAGRPRGCRSWSSRCPRRAARASSSSPTWPPTARSPSAGRASARCSSSAAWRGPEYSWEALVRDGEVWFANITAKETTGPAAVRRARPPDGRGRARRRGIDRARRRGARARCACARASCTWSSASRRRARRSWRSRSACRATSSWTLLGLTYGVSWFELVVRGAMGLPLPPAPAGRSATRRATCRSPPPGVVTRDPRASTRSARIRAWSRRAAGRGGRRGRAARVLRAARRPRRARRGLARPSSRPRSPTCGPRSWSTRPGWRWRHERCISSRGPRLCDGMTVSTLVHIADVPVGGEHFTTIAGPCAVESREQIARDGARRRRPPAPASCAAGAFKPRTSPYSFQGLGLHGLELLREVKAPTGMPVVTEVIDAARTSTRSRDVADASRSARATCRTSRSCAELGRIGGPSCSSAGSRPTVDEFLLGRRVHPRRGQRAGHPVRARDPHLRDRHPLHARPRRRRRCCASARTCP